MEHIMESWKIFISNLNEIFSGYMGVAAIVLLFAIFLIFWNISKGFGSHK